MKSFIEKVTNLPWHTFTFWQRLFLVTFTLASLSMATVNLDHPLWIDEAIAALPAESIHKSGLPEQPFELDYMPWQIKHNIWDPATPLYRYALAVFTWPLGFTETSARIFSLLCAGLLLLVLYFFFRHLANETISLFAIAILSSSPLFLSMARQARHFTFLMLAIALALYFFSRRQDHERYLFLWVLGALACALSQVMGYLIAGIFVFYIFISNNERYLHKKYTIGYAILISTYLLITLPFYDTLPFFHQVDCQNRIGGCHPQWHYYLIELADKFFAGIDILEQMAQGHIDSRLSIFGLTNFQFKLNPWLVNSLSLFFFVALIYLIKLGKRLLEPKHLLILLWMLVPLIILSLREVKFGRYLFLYTLPPLAYLVARGIDFASEGLASGKQKPILALAFLIPCLLLIRPGISPGHDGIRFRSAYYDFFKYQVFERRKDNHEFILWQANIIERFAKKDDIIISSFNDGSLKFKLKRQVVGMLASHYSDDDFMKLIKKAKQDNIHIFFFDTLAEKNFCYVSSTNVRSIDCRKKFKRFYQFCLADTQGKVCRRIIVNSQNLARANRS